MLPDSLLLCAQTMQTSLKKCPGGIIQVAIAKEASLRTRASIKQGFWASGTPCCIPLPPFWPQAAAAQPPSAAAFGPTTTTPPTPATCPLPRQNSAATSERMPLEDQMARHALTVTCPTCVKLALWTIHPRGLDRPRVTPGPQGWSLVRESNSPLDWDADLVRTALQHRLRIPFSETRNHHAPCAAKSTIAFVITPQSAHVRETATRHNAIAHVFEEAAHEARLRPQSRPTPTPARVRRSSSSGQP